jgi:hypothetical protein
VGAAEEEKRREQALRKRMASLSAKLTRRQKTVSTPVRKRKKK